MYDYVEGELVFSSAAQVVLDVGGVGYRLTVPLSSSSALPGKGRVRLFTHLMIREDELRLYGFATETERRLFLRLNTVGGIGPTTALGLLSGLSVDEFRQAVADGAVAALCRVKGVGRKTAERIVVELRDEMQRDLLERPTVGAGATGRLADAIAAMLALGYRRSEAEKGVRRAVERLGRESDVEALVREALQHV